MGFPNISIILLWGINLEKTKDVMRHVRKKMLGSGGSEEFIRSCTHSELCLVFGFVCLVFRFYKYEEKWLSSIDGFVSINDDAITIDKRPEVYAYIEKTLVEFFATSSEDIVQMIKSSSKI